VPGGPRQFVQVALHQTAPTTVLDMNNGISAWLIQGEYGPNQPGNWVVPSTSGLPTGSTPVCNVSDPGIYSLRRGYIRPGGQPGTETSALSFVFGGLNLNPPPSPSVDANGRYFLGTFALQSYAGSPGTTNSSIIFRDPNPNNPIAFYPDDGTNLDSILFGPS